MVSAASFGMANSRVQSVLPIPIERSTIVIVRNGRYSTLNKALYANFSIQRASRGDNCWTLLVVKYLDAVLSVMRVNKHPNSTCLQCASAYTIAQVSRSATR
eukprot:scaffold2632_cov384-Pavlova_lutheri.AAC.6